MLAVAACSGAPVTTPVVPSPPPVDAAPPPVDAPPPPPPPHVLSSTAAGLCVLDAAHQLLCSDGTAPFAPRAGLPRLAGLASDAPCGWTASGDAWCWTLDPPVAIATVDHVLEMAGSASYACARRTEHRITCWAMSGARAGAPGTTVGLDALADVVTNLEGRVDPALPAGARVTPARDRACTIDLDGVACWGLAPITSATRVANTAAALDLIAGPIGCAAFADHHLACWGAPSALGTVTPDAAVTIDGIVLASAPTTP